MTVEDLALPPLDAGLPIPAQRDAGEAELSYEINPRLYEWVGRLMDLIQKVAPLKIRVHNLHDQAERGDIFLFNHFSRFETFLPQYVLYRKAKVIGRSLAAPEFLGPDWFGDFLRSLGAIPTNLRGIIDFMGDEILAGRKMVIFPEGSMIKDKKVVDHRGRLQIYSRERGMRRTPHTGSAVTALKAQYRLYYLKRALEEGNTALQDRLLADWPTKDAETLQRRLSQPITIVPANITFFPLRITDNLLQAVAERLAKVKSRRLLEELRIEGNLLFRPTDMDIRFSEPIAVAEYLTRVDRWLLDRIYRAMARQAAGHRDPDRRLQWLHRLQQHRTHQLAEPIMQRYMRDMYGLTTINLSHLVSNVLYRTVSESRRQRIGVSELGEMTYVALQQLQRSKRVFLHPDLTHTEKNIEIPCQPLQRFHGCLGRAEDQRLIHLDHDEFFLSPKLTDVHDFDEIRLENHIQLAVNESQPVVDCVRAVDEALALKPEERRRMVAAYLQDDDTRLFQHDKAMFTQPHYHRLNQYETGKRDGASFLLEGSRDDLGILLLHGFSASPAEVRPLGEALHGEGFTVFAPRLRGHGTSPYDLATRTWEEWLASARLGYTLLRNRCRRVAIVGHSMGGCLAFLIATEGPVAGVVSISTPTRLASRRSSLVPLLHKANRLANLLTGVEGLKNFDRTEPENPDINYLHLPISGVRELQNLIAAFQELLPEVKVPVLVLQADEDPTVEPASAHDIEERLGSHNKRVVIIPAERHVLVLDDRLGVHRRVRKFMVGLADGTIGNG